MTFAVNDANRDIKHKSIAFIGNSPAVLRTIAHCHHHINIHLEGMMEHTNKDPIYSHISPYMRMHPYNVPKYPKKSLYPFETLNPILKGTLVIGAPSLIRGAHGGFTEHARHPGALVLGLVSGSL